MTAEEALALIPEWQKILRVQDWHIHTAVTEDCDEPLAKVRGNKYKAAELTLLDPVKINPRWLGNLDPEVSIVHELLHLQEGAALTDFFARDENKFYSDEMERLIELTAIALVTLKRRAEAES